MSRSTEIAVLVTIIAVTLITFVAWSVDTLGIIVLSICVVCLGMLLAQPDDG